MHALCPMTNRVPAELGVQGFLAQLLTFAASSGSLFMIRSYVLLTTVSATSAEVTPVPAMKLFNRPCSDVKVDINWAQLPSTADIVELDSPDKDR